MSDKESKIYNVIIAILVVAIIVCGIILYIKKRPVKINNNENEVVESYRIELLGEKTINLYVGEKYNEPGYKAYNQNDEDVSNLVQVSGSVDTKKEGVYEIVYSITTEKAFEEERRTVNINSKDNAGKVPKVTIDFHLNGNTTIQIKQNEKFTDPGFVAIDSNKKDLKNYVTVSGKVDTSKVGSYDLTYTLKYESTNKTLKRKVNVISNTSTPTEKPQEPTNTNKYTYKLSTASPTRDNVVISVTATSSDFAYFMMPNSVKNTNKVVDYTVKENGKYTFVIYNTSGKSNNIVITVSNIDKVAPIGSCKSTINGSTTTYTVTASDSSGIKRYIHNGDIYTTNTFTVNKVETNGIVYVYDNVDNYTKLTCTSSSSSSSTTTNYIGPTSSNKVVKEYNSNTLKYWVEKPSDYYMITHIWAQNPYNQLKTGIPSTFGELATARTIMNKEISNNKYTNKGMVAINASPIVSNTYNTNYLNANQAWLNTSITPIVIVNGVTKRDFTSGKIYTDNDRGTAGLKKNGNLEGYTFVSGTNSSNVSVAKKIVADGVKNTFGYGPILVKNSTLQTSASDNNSRQGICQIDANNFAIITSTTNSSTKYSNGLSYKKMGNMMIDLKCKIGFNLDGGESISAFYKINNGTINTIKESTREIVDILYFVEQ